MVKAQNTNQVIEANIRFLQNTQISVFYKGQNFLRSTMSGERLEDLIVLAAEKDLTDQIDLDIVVKALAAKKNRKLKIKLTR